MKTLLVEYLPFKFTPEIKNVNFVTESQYLSLIRYHQLVEELK